MHKLKKLIVKNKKILIYFGCSVCAALLEAGLLLVFKNVVPAFAEKTIVYANTTAILVSSILHFILTSKLVFRVRMNFSSAVVYIVTFFIGLGIQNCVIWLTYRACSTLLHDADAYQEMHVASNPYGDGTASRQIADIILKHL